MNQIFPKVYQRKAKDKSGNWFPFDVYYYSIGQVRNLFHEKVKKHSYRTSLHFTENGFGVLTGTLEYTFDGEITNSIELQSLINMSALTAQDGGDKTSENYNKKNTALEKRIKVMALGLDDPEEEEEEKTDYEKTSEDHPSETSSQGWSGKKPDEPASDSQKNKILVMLNSCGFDQPEVVVELFKRMKATALPKLTKREASALIDKLNAMGGKVKETDKFNPGTLADALGKLLEGGSK